MYVMTLTNYCQLTAVFITVLLTLIITKINCLKTKVLRDNNFEVITYILLHLD